MYYNGGCYYDPQLGRFIQPDPTVPDPTDSQSFNRYSYCGNNPLNETDPTGYDPTGDPGLSLGDDGSGGTWYGPVWIPNFSSTSNLYVNPDGSWGAVNSTTIAGVTFTDSSMGGPGWSLNSSTASWDGNIFGSATLNQYVPGYSVDGVQVPGFIESTTFTFGNNTPPPPPTQVANNGGGWLEGVTNAAGLLAAIPIPGVSEVAGLVNAAGEALQGHYLAAGIGVATAALAVVGLGVLGTIAKDATKAAEEGQMLYRGVPGNGTLKAILGKQGIAIPRGTALDEGSLIKHVLAEDVDAGVTSWTTVRSVAQRFAGPNGTVIEVDLSKVSSQMVPRPNVLKYGSENEVLLKGTVQGRPTTP